MSAADILGRFDVDSFRKEAELLSEKLNDISVSSFQSHKCVDCGCHLKTFGAVRCKKCNMRRVGKNEQL